MWLGVWVIHQPSFLATPPHIPHPSTHIHHKVCSGLSCAEAKQDTNDKSPWMSFVVLHAWRREKIMTNRKSDKRQQEWERFVYSRTLISFVRRNLAWHRALCNDRKKKRWHRNTNNTHTDRAKCNNARVVCEWSSVVLCLWRGPLFLCVSCPLFGVVGQDFLFVLAHLKGECKMKTIPLQRKEIE
jgi:hypothetical protein